MKTLLKIIIAFGLVLNINAQSIERTLYKINANGNAKNVLKLDKKLVISKSLLLDVSPQYGNLFMTRLDAKKAKINLKDFYDDFDLGINMGFNYCLKKQLHLKALYNIGLLKFNVKDSLKSDGYIFQLSIDYSF